MSKKNKLIKFISFTILLTIIATTLVMGTSIEYKSENEIAVVNKTFGEKNYIIENDNSVDYSKDDDNLKEETKKEKESTEFDLNKNNNFIDIEKNSSQEQFSEVKLHIPPYKTNLCVENLFIDKKGKEEINIKKYLKVFNENVENYSFDNKLKILKTILKDKNLSILGDSISTYTNYSNGAASQISNTTLIDNKGEYPALKYDVTNVHQTWWMQVANETGMNLLVNNSSAGGTVASGGQTRSMQLHDNIGENAGTIPDIIIVYYGINDIKSGSTIENFKKNYESMLSIINNTYPNAEVFVLTHVPYNFSSGKRSSVNDELIEEFNEIIRNLTNSNSRYHLVDYYKESGIRYDNHKEYMQDNLHPNALGMDLITKSVEIALFNYYLK